jgi:lambda family phage portal protein
MSSNKNGVLNAQARYDAASQGRRMQSWKAPSTGPNASAIPAAGTVRDRARDAARNDAIGAQIVRAWTSALVGSGIQCRTKSTDPGIKQNVNDAWAAWCDEADFDGCQNLDGIQATVAAAMVRDGECFVHMMHMRAEDKLSIPLQLRVYEADMLPLWHNTLLEKGSRIVAGIETDARGKRQAYHFYKNHPGENSLLGNQGTELVRVPADEICHVFLPERPGQQRGVSWLAPILVQLKCLADFEDAMLERVKLQNLFTGFITRPEPMPGSEDIDPITGQTISFADNGMPMVSLEPGGMVELAPGENISFSNPTGVSADYDAYRRNQMLTCAAGVGLPYVALSGDVVNLSDRSLRVVLNEFRRVVEARQWSTIIAQFLKPVRKAVMGAAMLHGPLWPSHATAGMSCEWTPPRWKYLHPTQDIASLRAEVDAGFRSRASVIAEMGFDIFDVDTERAADLAREQELGLSSPENQLTQAEIDKLEAETRAANASAGAAKASQKQAEAATTTANDARAHIVATEKLKTETARLEVEAANLGLAELRGAAPDIRLVAGRK